jgi:hypothetical protein
MLLSHKSKTGRITSPIVFPYAHVRMHALKGLACRARGTPASSLSRMLLPQ